MFPLLEYSTIMKVEVTLHEWLQKHDCNFFCKGICKLAHPRDRTIWASFIMFYPQKILKYRKIYN